MEFSSCNNSVNFNSSSSFVSMRPNDISGCVFYCNFNNSGTSVVDEISGLIGSERVSTYGGDDWIRGIRGSALLLSGNYFFNFGVPSWSNVSEGSPFTVSTWANISGTSKPSSMQGVIVKGSTSSCRWGIDTISGTNVVYRFGSRSGAYSMVYTYPSTNKDEWHNILGTYNGSNCFYGYRDGKLLGSYFTNGSKFGIFIGSVIIGRNGILSGNIGSTLNVSVDETAFFNRQLSDQEIQQLYNFGYAKFNDLNGQNNSFSISGQPSNYTFETNNQLTIQEV